MSAEPLYTMDLVEDILRKYGEEDGTFGHHAWLAAFFVSRDQMSSFSELVENLLRSRTDDSVAVTADSTVYAVPSAESKRLFVFHFQKMFWAV